MLHFVTLRLLHVGLGAAVAWNGQGVFITRSAVAYASKFREVKGTSSNNLDNSNDYDNDSTTMSVDGDESSRVEQRAIGTFNGLFNGE